MSTDTQLKGDSLRRQIERTEDFARQNGLVLDDSFHLRDIGMSAYDGSNIERGQLGKFLQAVKTGEIEKGSYLVVESLDRLSRQKVISSIRIFLDLLEHGINIATLIDKKVYTPENTDHAELILSLNDMSRAHGESFAKSDRLTEAWNNKRANAKKKILTALTKGWLRARPDRKGFDIRDDRAQVVRRIFRDADGGMGADLIARRLNHDRVPTFGKSKGWHKSYVLKILSDRAVLGEFQPHTKRAGKRIPLGEVVTNYYPPVIDEALFYKAQAARHGRRQRSAGRKGPSISNLFSGLARCGVCGGPMHLINKGAKGGRRLVCDRARRDAGCHITLTWDYDDFELSFLTFIKEADLPRVIGDLRPKRERAILENEITEGEGRLLDARQRRERTFALITGGEATDFLASKLRDFDVSVAAIEQTVRNLRNKLTALSDEETSFNESKAAIGELIERIQSGDPDELLRIRSSVASRLRGVIANVMLWTVGQPHSPELSRILKQMFSEETVAKINEELKPRVPLRPRSVVEIQNALPRLGKELRCFFVSFKDGTFRFVMPDTDDPRKFRVVAATKESWVSQSDVLAYLLARYGIEQPSEAEIEHGLRELQRDPEALERYGADILLRHWKAKANPKLSVPKIGG